MRHRRQAACGLPAPAHRAGLPVDSGAVIGRVPSSPGDLSSSLQLTGSVSGPSALKGSTLGGKQLQFLTTKVVPPRCPGLIERPRLEPLPLCGKDCSHAKIGRRPIFVDAKNGMADADIYDFSKLVPGNIVAGPAVIHTPITTIVLQDKQRGTMDGFRNVVIEFDA